MFWDRWRKAKYVAKPTSERRPSVWFAHFRTITDDPDKFVLWVATAIVLSLTSFWLPFLIGVLVNRDLLTPMLANNPFLVFSVTFLSNSILTSISYVGVNSNRKAASIRTISVVVVFMFIILLSSLIPIKYLLNTDLSVPAQLVLLAITILIGVYVYGFREGSWEKSLDDERKAQDDRVDEMSRKATSTTDDGTGVPV